MIGHQIEIVGDNGSFLTLADLWPTPCLAAIVGVNPAPKSVERGHYYQGANGRTAMHRLRAAGLLPPDRGSETDDEAVRAHVGFTDLVKRPTRRAADLRRQELLDGRDRLRRELRSRDVPLVVCVFKPAVAGLLDQVDPPGFQSERFERSLVFRMPGPYAAKAEAEQVMAQLAAHLGAG